MSCTNSLTRRIVWRLPAVVASVLFCSISDAAFTEVVVEESFDSRANLSALVAGDHALRLTGVSSTDSFFP